MPRFRILVVEDEPRIRDITGLYLERPGYAVSMASDGREGLEAFDADPPDLAIIDLLLPGLADEALIRAIREVSARRRPRPGPSKPPASACSWSPRRPGRPSRWT
ncbi:MAG TPA: response regulator, partial [Candidatus Limnocylindrales bacterium]|nr:response regulator [Candidatus Limnocylindrales bacterium]